MLLILFQLDAARYAMAAEDVLEVLPLVALRTIPGAPQGVAGLMNYRGAPVPVLDFALLTLGRSAARRVSTRLLIVRYPLHDGTVRPLGLIAEHATEIATKAADEFKHASVRTSATEFLGRVATDPSGLIQRIDVAGLLSDETRARLFPESVPEQRQAAEA